jgi:hypothetical protein
MVVFADFYGTEILFTTLGGYGHQAKPLKDTVGITLK